MILETDNEPAEIAEHAMRLLDAAGVERETAAQLAIAVAVASREPTWQMSQMEFLLARALQRLQREDAAERLLARVLPGRRIDLDACLAAPPELLPLLRSGALAPAGSGQWRLDGSRIRPPDTAGELDYASLFTRLARLLAPLWHEQAASTRLEMSGWTGHASRLYRRRADVSRCCRRWRDDLEAALRLRHAEAGVETTPSVILGDPV